jgi:hypothetical protein
MRLDLSTPACCAPPQIGNAERPGTPLVATRRDFPTDAQESIG